MPTPYFDTEKRNDNEKLLPATVPEKQQAAGWHHANNDGLSHAREFVLSRQQVAATIDPSSMHVMAKPG
jgi:hypothetical protein